MKNNVASVATLLATIAFWTALSAQGATPPVAKKVSEFKEKFDVGGADFSPDATQLAVDALFVGPHVHIWEWRKQHIDRTLVLEFGTGEGRAIRYSPDGMLLAVGHDLEARHLGSGLIRIWDLRTGEVVHNIAEPDGATPVVDFSFSPDGRFFIRTVQRALIHYYLVVHETQSWKEVWNLNTDKFRPRVLALSPDAKFAALGGETCEVKGQIICHPQIAIVDMEMHQIARTIEGAFSDNTEMHAIAWSPDGTSVAAGAIVDGSFPGPDAVRFFDPKTGAMTVSEPAKVANVNSIRYSPDGRYFVEAHIDGHVRIWDGQHKKILQEIPADIGTHPALSISRDSRYLMIGLGQDVSVWELK